MALMNTGEDYGRVARWLHWLTALQLHLSIGISILVLASLRLCWRLMNRVPEPPPGGPIEHAAARGGHVLLYVIMFLAPVTGCIGTGVA